MKIKNYILGLMSIAALTSCEDLLEIDAPNDSLSVEETYSSTEGIRAALTGLYAENYLSAQLFYQQIDVYLAMFADELVYYRTSYAEYYANEWTQNTSIVGTIWNNCYNVIFRSNDFIINAQGSTLLSEQELNEGLAAAYYFRAIAHFWLVSLYGDVPLIVSNDYKVAQSIGRTPSTEVYAQIEEDLKLAQRLLEGSKNPKTRVTQDGVTTLLARVYLYQKKWSEAKAEANKVIPAEDGGEGGTKYKLETLDRIYLAGSNEAIMQVNLEGYLGSGTYVGYTRYYYGYFKPTSKTNYYSLSGNLVADLKSDPDDARLENWTGAFNFSADSVQYYPFKYKQSSTPENANDYEYTAFFRLAELYLIRSEANVQLGDIEAAINDIDKIRNRAGQANFSGAHTREAVLAENLTQRRKELFTEFGHRWFDLIRFDKADEVYASTEYKTGWAPYKKLLPIPETQILANFALKQNEGYDY